MSEKPEERESIKVLQEAIELQKRKSADYQATVSTVRQADYYPRGIETIYDMVYQKLLRIRSVMDKSKLSASTNFESLEDSAIDAINYLSFFVSFQRGRMDGQSPDKDAFCRPVERKGSDGPVLPVYMTRYK